MNIENFSEIRTLVSAYGADELLHRALLSFYHIPQEQAGQWPLPSLREQFDHEEYREVPPTSSFFADHIQDICDHIDQYEEIYKNYLGDDVSRRIFCQLLGAKLTLDVDYLKAAYGSGRGHYFDPELFEMGSDEVYVDCGGYIGDTVLSFIQHCPDYQKIYVYEAAPEIMRICKGSLSEFSQDDSIVFREVAVFSQETELKFAMENGNGDSKLDDGGELVVSAVSLDCDIAQPVTFIKMDIEGSEAEAIVGAAGHIQRDTPKMAICIYHRKDDFWRLPQLIRGINPNYRFVIRHHQAYQFYDTVLYCIPNERAASMPGTAEKKVDPRRPGELRSRALLKRLYAISEEERKDAQAISESKIWCIRSLRSYQYSLRKAELTMTEQKIWSGQLQEGKDYLECELQKRENTIKELQAWSKQLIEAKDYFSVEVQRRDTVVEQQEALIQEKEGIIRQQEALIQEKEGIIRQQEALIQEKEDIIGQQEALIQEKEDIIGRQETEIDGAANQNVKLRYYLKEEIRKPWYKQLLRKSRESDYNL